jgi:hypothetical protein
MEAGDEDTQRAAAMAQEATMEERRKRKGRGSTIMTSGLAAPDTEGGTPTLLG